MIGTVSFVNNFHVWFVCGLISTDSFWVMDDRVGSFTVDYIKGIGDYHCFVSRPALALWIFDRLLCRFQMELNLLSVSEVQLSVLIH